MPWLFQHLGYTPPVLAKNATGWCIWFALAFAACGIYTTQAGKINFANFFFWSTGRISFRFGPDLIHLGFRGFGLTLPSSPIGTVGPLARAGAACRPWDSHSCYKCGGFAGLSDQLGVHVPRVLFASCSYDMTSTCIIGRCRVVLSNMKFGATTALMLALGKRAASKQISATPASQK